MQLKMDLEYSIKNILIFFAQNQSSHCFFHDILICYCMLYNLILNESDVNVNGLMVQFEQEGQLDQEGATKIHQNNAMFKSMRHTKYIVVMLFLKKNGNFLETKLVF